MEDSVVAAEPFPRWSDAADEMGLGAIDLGAPVSQSGSTGAGLAPFAVDDLDGDGHLDVAATGCTAEPSLYFNRGDGTFEQGIALAAPQPDAVSLLSSPLALLVGDLDGDGNVELVGIGSVAVYVWRGLGARNFADPEVIFEEEPDGALHVTGALGDLDGDGALDIVLPSLGQGQDEMGSETGPEPAAMTILFHGEGGYSLEEPFADPTSLLAVRVTDRDGDGDLDLLAPPDHQYPTRFWRNDGGGVWTNDAAEVGAELRMAAMGIGSDDVNEDGAWDYCITDTGPLRCLVSDGIGGWAEAGAALELVPTEAKERPPITVGWATFFADLDNDGDGDVVQASGPHGTVDLAEPEPWADVAWRAEGGTFEDVSSASGLDSVHPHFAAIPADLDEDGALEIVVVGYGEAPHVMKADTRPAGHWMELDLVGPTSNPSAIGATVVVTAGEHRWMREVSPTSGPGTAPRRVHIGIGPENIVETLIVRWPGGAEETFSGVEVNTISELRFGEGG